MGADRNIDLSRGHPVAGHRRVLCRDHAGKLTDLDRVAAKPLGKGRVMLAAEQRRWRHHGDLPTRHDRCKRGPQRDLRLAEADIAADQPVHRPPGAQIFQHVLDRVQLIGGFLPRKTGAEFVVTTFHRSNFSCRR